MLQVSLCYPGVDPAPVIRLDRTRAVAEARTARELQRTARYPHITLAEVEAWLAAHDR